MRRSSVPTSPTTTRESRSSTKPPGPVRKGFVADVRPLSDPAADGVDGATLRDAAMALEHYGSVLCVVDATTLAFPDHPILVVSASRFHRDSFPEEFAAMRPFR